MREKLIKRNGESAREGGSWTGVGDDLDPEMRKKNMSGTQRKKLKL